MHLRTRSDASNYSVAIGTTSLPPIKVTFWDMKLAKIGSGKGSGINIDVAPFDIDRNYGSECVKRGWFYYCYTSGLCSEYPRLYREKALLSKERKRRIDEAMRQHWRRDGHNKCQSLVFMWMDLTSVSHLTRSTSTSLLFHVSVFVSLVTLLNSAPQKWKRTLTARIYLYPPTSKQTAERTTSITIKWDPIEGTSFYRIEVEET